MQIVAAYLMKKEKLTRDEALHSLRKRRACVAPNAGMCALTHTMMMHCAHSAGLCHVTGPSTSSVGALDASGLMVLHMHWLEFAWT